MAARPEPRHRVKPFTGMRTRFSHPVYPPKRPSSLPSPSSQRGRTLIRRPTACEDGGAADCERRAERGLVPAGVLTGVGAGIIPCRHCKNGATDVSTDAWVRTNVGTAWFTRPHVNSRVKGPAASFCAPAAAPKCSSVAVAIAAKPTAVMAVPTMLGAKISARPASVTKRAPEAGQFMPPGHVAIALDKRA